MMHLMLWIMAFSMLDVGHWVGSILCVILSVLIMVVNRYLIDDNSM